MASRHLARSIAVQTLYEWDFLGKDINRLDELLKKNIDEFGPGMEDPAFPRELTHGVIDHLEEVDTIIEKAAPEWPIQQIAIVDRNILRLGLYELLYGNYQAVPPKVAINEAIELAKSFGGESSGKFVNGVLGTVYREMGEPEKNHPRRGEKKEAGGGAPEIEELAGAVVFRRQDKNLLWLMIHDVFGYWTLVKGHKKDKETLEETAAREVREEVGVNCRIVTRLGQSSYPATNERGEKIMKRVTYFLAETNDVEFKVEEGGGIAGAEWFPMEKVHQTKHYEDTNPIIETAVAKLTNP